jgi:hypothetical protein
MNQPIHVLWNVGPGVEQVHTHGGIKAVNGIPNLFENFNRTLKFWWNLIMSLFGIMVMTKD